jgi:hypothetical protein
MVTVVLAGIINAFAEVVVPPGEPDKYTMYSLPELPVKTGGVLLVHATAVASADAEEVAMGAVPSPDTKATVKPGAPPAVTGNKPYVSMNDKKSARIFLILYPVVMVFPPNAVSRSLQR